jgi:hypothetical protein
MARTSVDPGVQISTPGTLEASLREFYRGPQFQLVTLAGFAGIGLVLAVVAGLISRQRVASRKKKILRNRLSKDGWKWRRLKSLSLAIREDEPATRELLFEIGARASTRGRDVWTLEK